MEINTSALCDLYGDQIDVLEPLFSHFGGLPTFAGQIHTVKCFEDSSVIATALAQNGQGKVLMVDGGGSMRRALFDLPLAKLALQHQWQGVILFGAVRDVDQLEELELGIMALASIPVAACQNNEGQSDIAVNFAGVTFWPDDYVYADSTGIVLSQERLDIV